MLPMPRTATVETTDQPLFQVIAGNVAIAHDYLTVVGGAERVVLSLTRAFPGAPVYTSLYEPEQVAPELAAGIDVRPSVLNRVGPLRNNHRAAMPLLGPIFNRTRIDSDVVVCSTSGWAHGITTPGRKIAYCHNPPRWVHQRKDYTDSSRPLWWMAAAAMHPYLKRWDRKAAASCDRYLANSSIVAERVRVAYGRDAEVVPPPIAFDASGPQQAIPYLRPGFLLSVSRLIGHKNVDAVVEAFATLPDLRLVVVGDGPESRALAANAPSNVEFTGRVSDDELRWLFANSRGLISASREDFGLTPLEAAHFAKPSALLRYGGFLDTMIEDETAVFFDTPEPSAVAGAVRRMVNESWDGEAIIANAERFSVPAFEQRLREIVAEELREAR